jgi:amino acid transporter
LIFAFVGIEIALVPSGEIREPARTVPRALLLALGIVTLLYVAVQLVAHAVLGAELARFTDAPLAEVASRALGGWGRSLVLLGGSISMLGFLSGDALATPRALFAFARDRLLPTPLARVHPRFHTPWIAILVHATIAWITASMGTFSVLIVLSNVAILSSYLLCCAAAIALQRKHVSTGGIPFSVPGGPVVPVAACIVLVWLLSHATVREFGVTGAAVAFALLLYGVRSLRRSC